MKHILWVLKHNYTNLESSYLLYIEKGNKCKLAMYLSHDHHLTHLHLRRMLRLVIGRGKPKLVWKSVCFFFNHNCLNGIEKI